MSEYTTLNQWLHEALREMPLPVWRRLEAEYQLHIENMKREGLTELEAVQALGSANQVRKSLKRTYLTEKELEHLREDRHPLLEFVSKPLWLFLMISPMVVIPSIKWNVILISCGIVVASIVLTHLITHSLRSDYRQVIRDEVPIRISTLVYLVLICLMDISGDFTAFPYWSQVLILSSLCFTLEPFSLLRQWSRLRRTLQLECPSTPSV